VPRIGPIVGLLAFGCVLAACGSNDSTHSTGAHAAGVTATSPSTATALTKAKAAAYAHAVNLTAADLPGFKVSSSGEREPEKAAEQRHESRLLRCVHVASGKALAEVDSKGFQRETSALAEGVKSEVTIAPSARLAANELAVIRGAHARACVAHYLGLILKGKQYRGATFGAISIVPGTPPAPGTSGGFGWRITVKINVRRISTPLFVDVLGFVSGPAEVSLYASGFPAPFSARGEERLFSLLLGRAKSHSL
jgi:hypothetical protein